MHTRNIRLFSIGAQTLTGVGDARGLGWLGRVLAKTHVPDLQIESYPLVFPNETTEEMSERWEREVIPRLSRDESVENRLVIAVPQDPISMAGSSARARLSRPRAAAQARTGRSPQAHILPNSLLPFQNYIRIPGNYPFSGIRKCPVPCVRQLFVFRPRPADIFRPGPRTDEICLANSPYRKPHRDRDVAQMHAYESIADIDTGVSLDMLDRDRVRKAAVGHGCKRAAGMRLWHHRDNLISVFFGAGPLNYQGAVEVLAALRCKKDTGFHEPRVYTLKHGPCRL